MTTKHKAAIIGFGGMGQRHRVAYQKAGVEVVAICDLDPKRVKTALPDFPESHIFDDYGKLLAAGDYDIVSIVTNGPTHAEVTISAARAGIKNILCEKPVATNLKDADKAMEACRLSGSRLAVNHIRRWSPNHRKLKKAIQEGMIGELRHIYFQSGSTGLGNMGIHFFDNMRFFTDSEAEWVIGFTDKTGTPNPRGPQFSDPGGYGMLQFANGARAFIDTSEDTGVRHICHLAGAFGRIIIEEWGNEWKVWARDGEGRRLPLTRYIAPMGPVPFHLDAEFDIVELTSLAVKELLAGGEISCDGDAARKALEMVVAFHVSDAADHRKVRLPLAGDALSLDVRVA